MGIALRHAGLIGNRDEAVTFFSRKSPSSELVDWSRMDFSTLDYQA
jgi:hypothetical protein